MAAPDGGGFAAGDGGAAPAALRALADMRVATALAATPPVSGEGGVGGGGGSQRR